MKLTIKKFWLCPVMWWQNASIQKQQVILTTLNYMLHAFFISIFVCCIFSFFIELTKNRLFWIYICTLIFLWYFEYYYKWLRSDWKIE